MNFKKWSILLILPLLAYIYTACTSPVVCAVEAAAVTTTSNVIVAGLQCNNAVAVTQSVQSWANSINLCSQSKGKKTLDPVVCGLLATEIVAQLKNVSIPAAWGCSATVASGALSAALSAACVAIPIPIEPKPKS